MKQIIASVILILVLSILSFAQQEETPEIPVCKLPFDTFGNYLTLNDQKQRLDNFFIGLLYAEQSMKGFVILQLAKDEPQAKKAKRLNEISKHLAFRKIDRTRIVFVIFEGDEEYKILQIATPNKEIKDLYYTINEIDNYQVIKGEDFSRKIKELFAKK